MTPPSIRPIGPGDWPAVDRIQRACFDPSVIEPLAVFQSFSALSSTTCLIASSENRDIGYLLAHPWVSDDFPPLATAIEAVPAGAGTLFIHDLAVMPECRKLGAASALCSAGLAAGKLLGLTSASLLSVQGSQPFWERQGFVPRPEVNASIEATVRRFTQMAFMFMSRPHLD